MDAEIIAKEIREFRALVGRYLLLFTIIFITPPLLGILFVGLVFTGLLSIASAGAQAINTGIEQYEREAPSREAARKRQIEEQQASIEKAKQEARLALEKAMRDSRITESQRRVSSGLPPLRDEVVDPATGVRLRPAVR